MAIRYYRRLLQMGVNNTEVWNNVGLCCFYSSQYDMALGCFDRALSLADDDAMADVWYNIGHVGVSLGDLGLAYQAFKIAVSVDASHGEALNNIAVLEMRRQKFEVAKTCLATSCEVSPFIFEPFYNSGTLSFYPRHISMILTTTTCAVALMSYRMGDFQESFRLATIALKLNPNHVESKELQTLLQKTFLNT